MWYCAFNIFVIWTTLLRPNTKRLQLQTQSSCLFIYYLSNWLSSGQTLPPHLRKPWPGKTMMRLHSLELLGWVDSLSVDDDASSASEAKFRQIDTAPRARNEISGHKWWWWCRPVNRSSRLIQTRNSTTTFVFDSRWLFTSHRISERKLNSDTTQTKFNKLYNNTALEICATFTRTPFLVTVFGTRKLPYLHSFKCAEWTEDLNILK